MAALRTFAGLGCGIIFGLGLAISGMMNPARVIGFLDVAGDWDPTLAFVMGGALLVAAPAYRLILGRGRPILDDSFSLPKNTLLDRPLILGSALFGVGWGLVGFCPGPAVAAVVTGLPAVLGFLAAMLAGMALHAWISSRQPVRKGSPEAAPRTR
ncbi:MAG TPA: YeeE/YedE family protein [Rubrobacter sp.]|nr:YeeE/YedE family protein [Rubrobacter sp.]